MIRIEREFGAIKMGHESTEHLKKPKEPKKPINENWSRLYEFMTYGQKRMEKFKEMIELA